MEVFPSDSNISSAKLDYFANQTDKKPKKYKCEICRCSVAFYKKNRHFKSKKHRIRELEILISNQRKKGIYNRQLRKQLDKLRYG